MRLTKQSFPVCGPLVGLTLLLLAGSVLAHESDHKDKRKPHDTLAPTVTVLAPEEGLVTADPLTPFRFSVEDPAQRVERGYMILRSGLDPDSLRLTVNGEDRTAQAVLHREARCDPHPWWQRIKWLRHKERGSKEHKCHLVHPFDWFGWWKNRDFYQAVVDYDPIAATPLPQGDVVVVLTIADQAQNVGRAESRVFVDTLGPVIAAVTPASGSTLTDNRVALTFSLTDAGVGVAPGSVRVTVNGEDYTARATVSGGQLTVPPATAWAEGALVVSVAATDTLNNPAQAQFTYTVAAAPLAATPRAIPSRGPAPLVVRFIPEFRTDAAIEKFEWDFDGNGVFDRSEPIGQNQTYTYAQPGTYTAALRVTDNKGKQATGTVVVEVENAPPMVVSARATPSSGAVPFTVQFSVTANDAQGIAGYEWDFDGDGAYDLQTTSATATHTYETAGNFQARVRVSDTLGMTTVWSSAALAVHAGATGTPTASLSAGPADGKAPLAVTLTATASDPDAAITGYEWDFDGDGVIDTSGTAASQSHSYAVVGTFYPRVRVTSADGGTADAAVQVNVRPSVSLTRSTDTMDTGLGQSVNITTALGGATEVSLIIENRAGDTVRLLVPWTLRTNGSYVDAWNGLDDQGRQVAEGDYYAVLRYRADGQEYRLDARLDSGGVQFNPSRTSLPSRFSPLAGQPLSVTVTLAQAAEVTAFIGRYNVNTRLVTLLERRPLGRGTHVIVWNGEDGDGKLFHPPAGDSFLYGLFGFTLANNAVYVRSGAHVTNVTAAPSICNPKEGASRVSFSLSQPANVELTVADAASGRAVARRSFTGLTAGAQTIEWDGRTDGGAYAAPGRYRLGVTAVDSNGFRSVTVYTLQRVYY